MHPTRRADARRARLPIVGLAVAVAIVVAIVVARPATEPAQAPAAAAPARAAAPAALELPARPRVLVFGDSWTYGSGAALPTLGYAYALGRAQGWDTTVAGVRGSGYLKAGIDGGSFGERIAALDPALDPDVIIVQGSINDRRLPPEGYRDAVNTAWDALVAQYPAASIVIVGPAPQVLPVQPATARIDGDLRDLAHARGWWYISPLAEDWITVDNYAEVIDAGIGREHPSTNGHAYLAAMLADSLAGLGRTTDAAAAAPAGSEADR